MLGLRLMYSIFTTKKVLTKVQLNESRKAFLSLQERTKGYLRFASIAGCDIFAGLLCWLSCCCGIRLCVIEFNSGKVYDGIRYYSCFFGYFSCDFEFLVLKMGEKKNKGDAAINNKGKMYEDSLS